MNEAAVERFLPLFSFYKLQKTILPTHKSINLLPFLTDTE